MFINCISLFKPYFLIFYEKDECIGSCISEKAFECLNNHLHCQDVCQSNFVLSLKKEKCPSPHLILPRVPESSRFFDIDPNKEVSPAV